MTRSTFPLWQKAQEALWEQLEDETAQLHWFLIGFIALWVGIVMALTKNHRF